MSGITRENVERRHASGRVKPVLGDVHAIPFDDESVDLGASRGSVVFRDDLALAFSDCRRVLRSDGRARIGCGFGSASLRDSIAVRMQKRDPGARRGRAGSSATIRTGSMLRSIARESLDSISFGTMRDSGSLSRGTDEGYRSKTPTVSDAHTVRVSVLTHTVLLLRAVGMAVFLGPTRPRRLHALLFRGSPRHGGDGLVLEYRDTEMREYRCLTRERGHAWNMHLGDRDRG
jgi:hypothetical protein